MLIAGRLTTRVDPRLLMAFGIVLLSYTLYAQTGWTPDVSSWTVIVNTIIQGAGLGFVFIPLQVVAFATLSPALRTDGTSLLSLVRNLGSAVGVSATSALLARNVQIVHSELAARINPFGSLAHGIGGALGGFIDPATSRGAAFLDHIINQQAIIIAYLDDFQAMFWVTAPTVLLLLLMRRPRHIEPPDPAHAAMD